MEGTDPGIDVATFRKKGKLNCSWLTTSWDRLFGRVCDLKVTRETMSNALSGVRKYYQKQDRLEGTISLQTSDVCGAAAAGGLRLLGEPGAGGEGGGEWGEAVEGAAEAAGADV